MRIKFSRSFVHLWECALRTHEDIWDGDFLTGAQGVERQWFVSAHRSSPAEKPVRVRVAMNEQIEGELKSNTQLEFAFVQEDGAWKIDDIIFLDNIAYNKEHTPRMEESFRESFGRYACK
jgi:hypothetical protein